MTTVIASCPACGEVKLTPQHLRLRLCENAVDLSTYRFPCPSCRQPVEKEACAHQIVALMSAGVTVEPWKLPAEILEPRVGPPIGYDDLLDMATGLAHGDPWAELTP